MAFLTKVSLYLWKKQVIGFYSKICIADASQDAEWDVDWSLCNSNATLNRSEQCVCSVQFLWNPWGSLMHAFLYFLMTLTTAYRKNFLFFAFISKIFESNSLIMTVVVTNTFRTGREANLFASPPVFSLYTSATLNLSFIFYFAWIFTWNSQDWIGLIIK